MTVICEDWYWIFHLSCLIIVPRLPESEVHFVQSDLFTLLEEIFPAEWVLVWFTIISSFQGHLLKYEVLLIFLKCLGKCVPLKEMLGSWFVDLKADSFVIKFFWKSLDQWRKLFGYLQLLVVYRALYVDIERHVLDDLEDVGGNWFGSYPEIVWKDYIELF